MRTSSRPAALTLVFSLAVMALPFSAAVPAHGASDDAKLQKAIPAALDGRCNRMSAQAVNGVVPQAVAGVSCLDRGGNAKVDDVGLFLFSSKAALNRFWSDRLDRVAEDTGKTVRKASCSQNQMGVMDTKGGQLVCYQGSNGDARIRWIDREDLVYGALDTTWRKLAYAYDWWSKNIPAKAKKPENPSRNFLYLPFEEPSDGDWLSLMTSAFDHDRPDYTCSQGLNRTCLDNGMRIALWDGEEAFPVGARDGSPDSATCYAPGESMALHAGYCGGVSGYEGVTGEAVVFYDGHDGYDWALPFGSAIVAAASGTVTSVGNEGCYGWTVEVDHGNSYRTRYSHLLPETDNPAPGSKVKAGEQIGVQGDSTDGAQCSSTGEHLHFRVYRDNGKDWVVTDPFGWCENCTGSVPSDPLEPFNGETSKNLWLGKTPRSVGQQPKRDNIGMSWSVFDSEYLGGPGQVVIDPEDPPPPVAEPQSGPATSRPPGLPARVPWSAGEAHRVISHYDLSNPDGFGLSVVADPGDLVYPLYGGEVVHAGCASGRTASLGLSVIVHTEVKGHPYDAVYGHLAGFDQRLLEPGATVDPNEPFARFGSASVPFSEHSADCDGAAVTDDLFVGIVRDAEVNEGGQLSGGRVIYPEPLIGLGAYEGFTWWKGPATAINVADGTGAPTGRWIKGGARDGQDVKFGDKVKLVAKVKDDVPIREIRFTAYYPDWARPKSAERLTGFVDKDTWRILAVCRPPGVGGEPQKSKCKWDGSATNATVTYVWDPTAAVKEKAAPWQPLPRTAITKDSPQCVPASLSFDIYDSAGHRVNAPDGAKTAQRCRKATDKPGLIVNLQSQRPPAAPGNVRLTCKPRERSQMAGPRGTSLEACIPSVGAVLRWQDVAKGEGSYGIYARSCEKPDCGMWAGGAPLREWRRIATLPAGSVSWEIGCTDIERALPARDIGLVQLGVASVNAAGPSGIVPAPLDLLLWPSVPLADTVCIDNELKYAGPPQ